jgi:hypothetical protein
MNRRHILSLMMTLAVLIGSAGVNFGGQDGSGPAQSSAPTTAPIINGAELKYMSSPRPELDIAGTGFGAVQGRRGIQVDVQPLSVMPGWSILRWSETMITLGAANALPWEHKYSFAVTHRGRVASNLFSMRFLYVIDSPNPTPGLPGITLKVHIWTLPASQGSYALKLGARPFTIMTWKGQNSGPLEARVPSLPPGTYEVYLQKGADIVSKKASFRVLKPVIIKSPTF